MLVFSEEHIQNVVAVICSVALKAAKRDFPDHLNFAIICFNIKGFFHISKQIQFAAIFTYVS